MGQNFFQAGLFFDQSLVLAVQAIALGSDVGQLLLEQYLGLQECLPLSVLLLVLG